MLNIYPVLLLINEVVGGGYVNDSSMAAKQPVHWFFWRQGFKHSRRNACMGWFAQIEDKSLKCLYYAHSIVLRSYMQ